MKALVTRTFKDAATVGFLVAFLTVTSGILMSHVWNQYQIVQIGYEIAQVTHEHRRLIEENKKLAIESAVVGRTERMADVARERYGLEPVRPEQVRTISVEIVDADRVQVSSEHAALAR